MANIPNTEYITINKDGVFVGEKPATKYRGEDICWLLGLQKKFADIQRLNKNVAELHVLSSETCGESAKPGNPSGKHGLNAWCRVKFENGCVGLLQQLRFGRQLCVLLCWRLHAMRSRECGLSFGGVGCSD